MIDHVRLPGGRPQGVERAGHRVYVGYIAFDKTHAWRQRRTNFARWSPPMR